MTTTEVKKHECLMEAIKTAYQELLGCYNWLAGISRPDMAYAVSKLGSFTQDAKPVDLKRVRRILTYIRDTQDFSIVVSRDHYLENKVKLCSAMHRYKSCSENWG